MSYYPGRTTNRIFGPNDWVVLVAMALVVLGMFLALFSTPRPSPSDIREDKIRQCIADGGDPEFSHSRGVVTDYFGCVKP